jgi:hypothetical protein
MCAKSGSMGSMIRFHTQQGIDSLCQRKEANQHVGSIQVDVMSGFAIAAPYVIEERGEACYFAWRKR